MAVKLSRPLAEELSAKRGDLVYVTDRRWWTGGMRSTHALVDEVVAADEAFVELGPEAHASVVTARRGEERVLVERLY